MIQPFRFAVLAFILGVTAVPSLAQTPTQGPRPYFVGNRLGLPVTPGEGALEPISSNVKVYGAIYSAESCSYDTTRGVIVVPNRGVPQNVQTNNAWVSFINHEGSVHTPRWIGVQNPAERASLTPPLVLKEPYGSDIAGGVLYLAEGNYVEAGLSLSSAIPVVGNAIGAARMARKAGKYADEALDGGAALNKANRTDGSVPDTPSQSRTGTTEPNPQTHGSPETSSGTR